MSGYILLMHGDTQRPENGAAWGPYLSELRRAGALQGGSSIGAGACMRKAGDAAPVSTQIVGFVRVMADSLATAQALVPGNPTYEAGGTVEVRELPEDDA